MTSLSTALPLSSAEASSENRRFQKFDQGEVLQKALSSLQEPSHIAVFDLDSTLLDNSPRQARIVQEYGDLVGDKRIAAAKAEYWVDWSFETPLARCGLAPEEIASHLEPLKAFWRERFFTSEYCVDDIPNEGATDFLSKVREQGAIVCYVTGRHQGMGPGSVESFKRAGFPIPNGRSVHLLLKPSEDLDDDEWKVQVRQRLQELGEVRCAFDNEPIHINSYLKGFSGCYAVHLDTDHSGRPVEIHDEIPSIRNFVL